MQRKITLSCCCSCMCSEIYPARGGLTYKVFFVHWAKLRRFCSLWRSMCTLVKELHLRKKNPTGPEELYRDTL